MLHNAEFNYKKKIKRFLFYFNHQFEMFIKCYIWNVSFFFYQYMTFVCHCLFNIKYLTSVTTNNVTLNIRCQYHMLKMLQFVFSVLLT